MLHDHLGVRHSAIFRGDLHVRYAMVRFGQERFILVQPVKGNLKDLLDRNGEGTISSLLTSIRSNTMT
jgi:hypothetical protein